VIDRVQVFVLGQDGNLHSKYYDNGWTWDPSDPGNPGVTLVSPPSSVQASGANSIGTFVIGSDGNRYEACYNGFGWAWASFGTGS
jgi:hypothetical protein